MRLTSQPLPLGPADGRLTSREWLLLGLGALAITVLVCLAEPSIFGSTDWIRMHGFYKSYIQQAVSHGRLPLWNPHHWLGRPFLADIESGFFYPPEWLYLLLDLHLACALTCALHFLLCLYGAVKLSRALGTDRLASMFVAFVIGLGVPVAGCFTSGLVHYGQALCYLPLVFYLGMRIQAAPCGREVALLALSLGLQMLCGHPQAAWITQVGLAVFLVGRRIERPLGRSLRGLAADLGLAGLSLALGLVLAAVALLPLAELAGQGNRPAASAAFAGAFAEPIFGWATLLVPTQMPFFHFNASAQLYVGLIPLLAGVLGLMRLRNRNARALLVVAVFAALVAAGNSTPIFRLLFHVVPGLGWLRIHSRMTFLVATALVLAAGMFLSERATPTRREYLLLGGAALVACAIVDAFILGWPGFGAVSRTMALARGGAVLVAALLLGWWMYLRQGEWPRWHRVAAAVLVLATALDLGQALVALKQENHEVAPEKEEILLRRELEARGLFAAGLPPPRVFVSSFRENAGMAQGWSTPYGYSALAPDRVWKYMHEVLGVRAPSDVNTFPSRALDKFGPFPYASMALVAGSDLRAHRVILNANPDPRVYLAFAARVVGGVDDAIGLMRAGHDFHKTALVEQPLALLEQAAPLDGRVTITRFEPERISVAVQSAAPALLILAETWYPGWEAKVNGSSAPCLPANAWMRAVPVPAGVSEVVLTFHSTYLASGAAISLAALALVLLMLLWRRAAPSM